MERFKEILVNKLEGLRKEMKEVTESLTPLNNILSGNKEDKLPFLPNLTRTIGIEANFIMICEILEEMGEDLSKILTEGELQDNKMYKEISSKIDPNKTYNPQEITKLIKETLEKNGTKKS